MLYTLQGPRPQADRVLLHASVEAARAHARGEGTVFAVAVRFEERSRRVVPLNVDPQLLDPTWATPAEHHADGSVTAKGPLPESLILGEACTEPALRKGLVFSGLRPAPLFAPSRGRPCTTACLG
jgi:hypothetical protein